MTKGHYLKGDDENDDDDVFFEEIDEKREALFGIKVKDHNPETHVRVRVLCS